MATISSLGIGSGLDLSGLLDDLEDAENEKLTPIVTQQKSYQTKLSAFGTLESSLTSLRDSLEALSDPDTFTAVTSTITGSGVGVSTTGEAVTGRYQVSVSQLAQSQSVASKSFDSKSDDLGLSGALSLTVGSGDPIGVDYAEGDSLEDIRDAINAADTGASASIVNDGNGYRLVLTSNETGTDSEISLSGDTNAFGFSTTVEAQDAQLTVNGISITSQSNTVEDALQGVTLTLSEVTDGSETLTVQQDTESMTSAVQAFVDAYNSYVSTDDSLTSYNADSDTAGALLGNSTMRSIESRLRSAMSYSGDDDTYNMLSSLGIELQLDGTLEVDDDKLNDALANDSDAVSQFFAGIDGEGGFANSLDDTMGTILDDGGLLETATDGIDATLDRLDDRYTRMQESIDSTIERYRSQFSDLDSLVAQMNSTSDYLTQQFDALSAQTSS